jgi:GH25 family lysozyme M1 (1,4-beta-N-acetylmuramidase)
VRGLAAAGGLAAAVSLAVAPTAGAATTGLGGQLMRGIDISAYQHADGPIDWRLLARDGIGFAGVKVTEGTYYTNPYYLPDALAAAQAGLAVMPYVFANPDRAGGAATANFAVNAARYRRGSAALPFVVDLENDPYSSSDCYGLGSGSMIAWIAALTSRIRALTGVWPIIYSTDAWWQECTQSTDRFSADPLWLAAYRGDWPSVPPPWRRWAFWQYSNEGFLSGIGRTDLDYYQPVNGLPSLRPPATQKPKRHPKLKSKAQRGTKRAESFTNH